VTDDEPRVFEDDDVGYLAWCRDHPGGFVINALRGSFADPVLHRAECRAIQEHTGDDGGWTTAYVKVCADDPGDLTMWSYQQGTAPRDCTKCDPRGGRPKATPRKTRPSTAAATPATVDDWLAHLAATDPDDGAAGRRIIEWCGLQGLTLSFTKPVGSAVPESLVVSFALPRGNVGICTVAVGTRSLSLDGDELKRTQPFTTSVGYADLIDRVVAIPGARPAPKGRYPNLPIAALLGDETWASFTKAFEWILSEIRRSDTRR
jgi:hypothetical protein